LAFWLWFCVVWARDLAFCSVLAFDELVTLCLALELFPLPLADEVAVLLAMVVAWFVDVLAAVETDVAVPSWDWEMVWKISCIFATGAGITSAVVNTAAETPSATRRFIVLRSAVIFG